MKRIAHKTALHIGGWLFIGIGLLGLILPLIPGFVFIALGVYIISFASLWLYTKIDHIKLRYPKVGIHFDKVDKAISRFIKKAH
ncbi:MAG: hypothetical protein V4519_02570 [Patescibacteria group bacterium]